MNPEAIELLGTLQPDGTLVLDERPTLQPGRVKVFLHPAAPVGEPRESLVDFVKRARREAEAAGSHFMDDEQVSAWIEELRADDDRIERACHEMAEERRTQE